MEKNKDDKTENEIIELEDFSVTYNKPQTEDPVPVRIEPQTGKENEKVNKKKKKKKKQDIIEKEDAIEIVDVIEKEDRKKKRKNKENQIEDVKDGIKDQSKEKSIDHSDDEEDKKDKKDKKKKKKKQDKKDNRDKDVKITINNEKNTKKDESNLKIDKEKHYSASEENDLNASNIAIMSQDERNNENQNAPPQYLEENLGKMILDVDKGFLVSEKDYSGLANLVISEPTVLRKLIEEVELLHPRVKNENGEIVKYNICSADTGNMGCGFKESKSDFEQLGIGILFYFKILKVFTIAFFVLVLINFPLYYFYSINHPEYKANGYKDMFFKTTIGNIASSLKNCQKIPVEHIFNQDKYTFSLDCKKYNISSVYAFGLTSNYNMTIENEQNCQNFTTYVNITTDSTCSFEKYLNTFTLDHCVGKHSCKFTIDLKEIKENCTSSPVYDDFYFSYDCYDGWINGENVIDRSVFSFIVIMLDIASMTCLLICLIIIPISQQRTVKFFKENVIAISDYTIYFYDLGLRQDKINQELSAFLDHIYFVSSMEKDDEKDEENSQKDINIIYDVNYPVLTDRKLDLILHKNRVTEDLNNIRVKLTQGNLSEKEKIRMDKRLDSLRKREVELREDVAKANFVEFKYVNDIYITFTNQKIRDKIYNAYNRSVLSRFFKILCCQKYQIKHLYFRDKWLRFQSSTDEPSNIRWQNVPYSRCRRWTRKIISYIIALIVIIASFGIVIGTKYAQTQIDKTFNPNVDCSFIEYTKQDVVKEYNDNSIIERAKVKSYCFCLDTLISQGYTKTKEMVLDGNNKLCGTWLEMYFYSQSLMVATFIMVPLVNVILSVILIFLTEFERNKSVSMNAISQMWKSFLLQLINTAIVILVVNIYIKAVKDWNEEFPLFTGLFTDFEPRWYKNVGVTIIFFMVINIVTPHVAQVLLYLWRKCLKANDRGCCSKEKRTKKVTRKEFINLYLGPHFDIGLRYAQISTTIFVTVMYSSGMPILYVCCFLFFMLTYWIDKWLITRFYRNPAHIDLNISNLFNIIILFGVVVHYCFGIWTYGNESILTNNTNSSIKIASDWFKNLFKFADNSFSATVVNRLTYSYNVICLIFLGLIFVVLIFRVFFMNFVMKFLCCCCKQNSNKIKGKFIYDAIRIKGLYDNHQLRKAQYFKAKNSGAECVTLREQYLLKMLQIDRDNILRRYKEVTKMELDEINHQNFDNYMPNFINAHHISEVAPIQADISYNIFYIPEFRDVVYYELIVPFLNKEKKNRGLKHL